MTLPPRCALVNASHCMAALHRLHGHALIAMAQPAAGLPKISRAPVGPQSPQLREVF
jgi:hypothetical protein